MIRIALITFDETFNYRKVQLAQSVTN